MKTDVQLQQDVIDELNWDPSVDATQIGVEVSDGVVTLVGHVGKHAEKCNAERAAQRVVGVRALAVAIEVRLSALDSRTDADIARAAGNVLHWMNNLPPDAINVMVEKGWLTLSGEVEWNYQREAAAQAVQHLMGVTGVSNNIVLNSGLPYKSVKSVIESAIARRSLPDAQKITVKVEDHDVTLSGTVRTWAERDHAWHSAWGTPGVRNVLDNISVTD